MPRGVKHPEALVAAAKGLMADGWPTKVVARVLGLPVTVARDYRTRLRRSDVAPDRRATEAVRGALRLYTRTPEDETERTAT